MGLFLFATMIGICSAATYGHYVTTTSKSSYQARTTSWSPASNTGLQLSVDCEIRATSSKAYITDVSPDVPSGSRFDHARGRVWGDKGGEVWTAWVSGVSGEKSSKYSSLYTFYVEITDEK